MAALEREHVHRFVSLWLDLAATSNGNGRRVRRRLDVDGDWVPAYGAAWLRQSVARAHPYERAAARPVAALHRLEDSRDALVLYSSARPKAWAGHDCPPWLFAFQSLLCRRLGRKLRFFGWLLMHGALRCGGAVCAWAKPADLHGLVEACACQAMCCLPAGLPDAPPPCVRIWRTSE